MWSAAGFFMGLAFLIKVANTLVGSGVLMTGRWLLAKVVVPPWSCKRSRLERDAPIMGRLKALNFGYMPYCFFLSAIWLVYKVLVGALFAAQKFAQKFAQKVFGARRLTGVFAHLIGMLARLTRRLTGVFARLTGVFAISALRLNF